MFWTKARFLFFLCLSAISFAPNAHGIANSLLCNEVSRTEGQQRFDVLDVQGRRVLPKSRTPNADETQPAPVMPAEHTQARIQHTITNDQILKRKSNHLVSNFTETLPLAPGETQPKLKIGEYDKTRFRKVVIKGIGPHAAAVLFGMYETLGGKMSVFGFNKGEVVSEGVFGNPDPYNPHLTAELRTISQFADNVNPFGGPTQLDFAGLPWGASVPSSIIADMVSHGLARSAAEVMMKSEVVKTVPRKAVERAKQLALEYPTGLKQEVYDLAKEPDWPGPSEKENARYMHIVKMTDKHGNVSFQKFFSDHVVVGTGLGPPRNPFYAGKPKMANGKPMKDEHGDTVYEENAKPSKEYLLAKQQLSTIRPGADRPKGHVPLVHEASTVFSEPMGEIAKFTADGQTVIYGGGYSSVVAINRMFQHDPNPKKPIHMITRNPLDPVADSVTIAYLNWANSDLHFSGAREITEKLLPDGSKEISFKDANGDYLSFVAPPGRYAREVDRDVWGDPGKQGEETYTVRIAKAKGEERILLTQVKADTIQFEPNGDPKNASTLLNIRFEDAAGKIHTTTGRMILGVGQEMTNSQNTMWGENFTANEKRLPGTVHYGFEQDQAPQDVSIARQIYSLVWDVGGTDARGKPLPPQIIELDSNVSYVGPGAKRKDGPLVAQSILKLIRSPNTSPDSLAALGAPSREFGHQLGKLIISEFKVRPGMGKALPVDKNTIDLGATLPDYATNGDSTLISFPPMDTPAHLRDLTKDSAPSLRILSEGLFSEAGRLFGNFRVAPNPKVEENRIQLYFSHDPSGTLSLSITRLAGGDAAQRRLAEVIGADKQFIAQVDAWMRAHDSEITMWLPFDSNGAFRPDLIRVSTPLETVVKYFRAGYSMKQILEILPRPVTVAPEDLMLPWIEGNYRNLYEVVGGPDGRNVHVSPTGEDAESKKRYWVVSAQPPLSGPDAPMTKDVIVVEYSHTNQEVGIQSIVGAQIFMEVGLGTTLANMPDKAAQGLVGRRDTLKPEYRLFVVYRVINDGGLLLGDPVKAENPKVISKLAMLLARVHKAKHGQPKAFSESAETWIDAELKEMRGRGVSAKELADFEGLLRSPHFAGKMAHGDPRLVHIAAGERGVDLAGMHEVYKYKHPLQDLKILLEDYAKEMPQLTGFGPGNFDVRDALIADYVKYSGVKGKDKKALTKLLQSWKN